MNGNSKQILNKVKQKNHQNLPQPRNDINVWNFEIKTQNELKLFRPIMGPTESGRIATSN